MKMIYICVAIVCVLFPFRGDTRDTNDPSILTTQSKEKVLSLANKQPKLMDILLPDEKKGTAESITVIPAPITSNAVYWIKKVVRSQWLPPDIKENLIALKDVKQLEKKDKHGVVFSERKGDFLVLDYKIMDHAFHIQESGVSVSLRVDLPKEVSVSSDPSGFIKKCLADFLNIPSDALGTLDIQVEKDAPLYTVFSTDISPRSILPVTTDGKLRNESHWWERMIICTDGKFFFVYASEVEPGSYSPQAKPGLPDRF